METKAWLIGALAAALAIGCGPPTSGPPDGGADGGDAATVDGHHVAVRGGATLDGTFSALSVLVTLRDEAGTGPQQPWSIQLRDPSGSVAVDLVYEDDAAGSYVAWVLSGEAAVAGEWTAVVRGPTEAADVGFEVASTEGLAPAQVAFDGAVGTLAWPEVPGAGSYLCTVEQEGTVVTSAGPSAAAGCDVSSLPDGAYAASVLAVSEDLDALGADFSPSPSLGPGFDGSVSRIAFVKGASAGTLAVVPGGLDYGAITPGLALWIALTEGGAPPAAERTLVVEGPGLGGGSWEIVYPAGASRVHLWSYEIPADPGTWTVRTVGGTPALAATETVVDAPVLPLPTEVSATSNAGGIVSASWAAVPGAASYRVSLWREESGSLVPVSEAWTAGTTWQSGPLTAVSGAWHHLYVAASTAPMDGSRPARLAVSENVYAPAEFQAP